MIQKEIMMVPVVEEDNNRLIGVVSKAGYIKRKVQ